MQHAGKVSVSLLFLIVFALQNHCSIGSDRPLPAQIILNLSTHIITYLLLRYLLMRLVSREP